MSNSRDIADSAATINFIDTVTSNVQTQIDNVDSLPGQSGNTGKFLTTNGSAASWSTLVTDPTLGTLTQTFTNGQVSTISLTSSVLAPVVTVTKEVSQTGSTNNTWDVNSTSQNYTRLDSAPATTLNWVADLANASYSQAFSISSQEAAPSGISFNTDGSKMFVVGYSADNVNEYALSTSFDVSTASYTRAFSVAAQDTSPMGIAFNTDGTKMFVAGQTGDAVYEYALSTGFNISTASYTQTFSVSAQDGSPKGLAFNTDGSKMFVLGADAQDVYEYALTTGFDISTSSFTDSFSVSSQDTSPQDVAFSADGSKMFVIGIANDKVYEYVLTTSFDVSTASFDNDFSVASQETVGTGLAFNNASSKMFVVGHSSGSVNEYTLPVLLALGTGSFAAGDVGKTIEANSGAFVLTATTGTYVESTAPTSYAQVASGSWEMYAVVYNTTDGDLELSSVIDPASGFDASTAVYLQNFSVSQEPDPQGLTFSTDGTKMYIVGLSSVVNSYVLSTAFDLSTASFMRSFYVNQQETQPRGIAFNPDGTKMLIVGTAQSGVHEYTLSTGFNISTASFVDTKSVSSQDGNPLDLAFNANGTKMFIVGDNNNSVYEYALSTGFDVSTASYSSVSFSVSAQDTSPSGLSFSTDGTKMFVVGNVGQDVNEYALSTGFDISTASFTDAFSVASQETSPRGVAFNTDGFKMYVTGSTGVDVNQYTLGLKVSPSGYQPVHTTASTDTQYWADINSMTANQAAGSGNIYYAISTDDRTTWSVIKDVGGERDIVRNNGGTWQYNSNSTYASETWAAGTTNTELATLAEAMEGASGVTGQFNASTAVYSQNFSVATQEIVPEGIAFNTNGTKMFVVGSNGDDVNEYALSTGFDVSTASFTDSFNILAQDTVPQGIAFNTNGTKMFIVGSTGDDVNEYALTTGFDVSTASFTDSFSVVAQDNRPYGIAFNTDGTKMFIAGNTAGKVMEYALSTGFDVSTASFTDSFSTASNAPSPQGLAFNPDGTIMHLTDKSVDKVLRYTLTTGFDVSTASYSSEFSVASQDSVPAGLAFNTTGTKMFVVGTTNDAVYEYTVGTTTYTNQMDKTQLDAVTDPNHIVLGNDLDLAIVLNLTSGATVPSSNGVSINYDGNVLNKAAILGTDYDYDAPAQNKVRITALAANNLKIRVL